MSVTPIAPPNHDVILEAGKSLALPDDLSREDWEAIGQKLREAEQWTQWAIGEWLNFGERTWGDTYKRAAEITGYAVKTLQNIASVTKKVSPRGETLTFNHHKEVAALEPAEQERWLDKAERESWSTRELHDQLRLTRPTYAPAPARTQEIPKCRSCGAPCAPCSAVERMNKKRQRKGNR